MYKRGGRTEREGLAVVYLIDSCERGYVDAINLKNGEGRRRRKKRRVTEGWGGVDLCLINHSKLTLTF